MKKSIKALFIVLLFGILLIPSVKSQAAVAPGTPGGLGLADQMNTKFMLKWNYDANIVLSSDVENFGYEVVVSTLKDKKIATFDMNLVSNYSANTYYDATSLTPNVFFVTTDYSTVYMNVSNSKMAKQGFKYKVRAYTYDSIGNKVYGEYSKAKVIIPRAKVKTLKATSRSTGKITWSKVKGAKTYTVYVSKNGGSSYKKQGTVSGTSYTVKNMTLGKTYPIYVVANGIKYKKKKYNSTKPEVKSSNASTIKIYTY